MKIIKTIQRIPFHTILLGYYPLLALWLANVQQIPAYALIRPFVFATAFLLIIFLASLLITQKWYKAGLLGSFLLALFYLYGQVFLLIDNATLAGFNIGRHRFLIPLWIGLLLLGSIPILRIKRRPKNLVRILNIVSLFLVLFASTQLAVQLLRRPQTPVSAASPVNPAAGPVRQRDVYYILLDTYGRQDYLNQIGLDNSSFVQNLQALGFVVDSCALSNYDLTAFSLASSLNMNYLDALGVPMHPEAKQEDIYDLENMLKHSRVRAEFEKMGYRFITFKALYPWIDITDSDVYFDFQKNTSTYDRQETINFQYLFLHTTALRPVIEVLEASPNLLNRLPSFFLTVVNPETGVIKRNYGQYLQNEYDFDKLETIVDLPGAKFTYAHLFATHIPYVYAPDGSFQPVYKESEENYKNSILYTNTRILKIVETILQKSALPPIIILQGDHNFSVSTQRPKILNAYYLPDGGAAKAYPGMTPINTFRLVLDYYFGQKNGFLPDVSVHSPFTSPYQFVPVQPACETP